MQIDSNLKTQVAMTMLSRFNIQKYRSLIERCGGIEGFFQENATALSRICPEYQVTILPNERRQALDKAEAELKNLDTHRISVCSVEHYNYPPLLNECEDAPLVFYYQGELTMSPLYLAIVGTRKASEYCKARVYSILQELYEMGHHPVVVSGLAYGIDITAHLASLQYNFKTYAVLAHGLDTIYPAAHKQIAAKILAHQGALISEFPCATRILPTNFLQRNRIIAGLCQATLIAESAEKGGAMVTARIAASYNRDVVAFPGRPEDKYSQGCNLLIKQNIAALIENGKDLADLLNLPKHKPVHVQTSFDFFEAKDSESIILSLLKEQGCKQIDELAACSGISINELTATLLQLELEGKIKVLPGKNYIIN